LFLTVVSVIEICTENCVLEIFIGTPCIISQYVKLVVCDWKHVHDCDVFADCRRNITFGSTQVMHFKMVAINITM